MPVARASQIKALGANVHKIEPSNVVCSGHLVKLSHYRAIENDS
jgi:hypothetical protein